MSTPPSSLARLFVSKASSSDASIAILSLSILGIIFAFFQAREVAKVRIEAVGLDNIWTDTVTGADSLIEEVPEGEDFDPIETTKKMKDIHSKITDGAEAFLWAEYKYMGIFMAIFSVLLVSMIGSADNCGRPSILKGSLVRTTGPCWKQGGLTAISFLVGGATSIFAGYLGMRIAVFSNARTTSAAQHGWSAAFNTAFRAGSVMGSALCSLALLSLFLLIAAMHLAVWPALHKRGQPQALFDCVAGFGLGGSAIALFGRVGGGIYTKAADVGADLVGKVEQGMEEDDARNPATIADNVGDNVGDVAGMGADLFGSFAEATCACLVVMSNSPDLSGQFSTLMFPLLVSAVGMACCLLTSFLATHLAPVRCAADVERALRSQLLLSTLSASLLLVPLCLYFLPPTFCVALSDTIPPRSGFSWAGLPVGKLPQWCALSAHPSAALCCLWAGLWGGLAIGYFTDYITSNQHSPVRELASVCEEGAAVTLIFGMSLGHFSAVVPALVLAVIIYLCFTAAGMFGISLAALGMLATLATGLTVDAYGPVCDNAGGIAEMAGCPAVVRQRTDVLDAAGNTTAAIGKGFAIGSAALVSLALFGAFVTRVGMREVNILHPVTFASLLLGAMLPYWFAAMCLRSVGVAAALMVAEVRRQFKEIPGLLQGTAEPDTTACVTISTVASLREMTGPGLLVMGSPIVVGLLFGVHAVTGLLAGSLVSGVHMAISSSNMGGAWDNAKKYIEAGHYGGKHTPAHAAAVIGDTVGDPLKDTSGPALNILMKLMAILSLVFADVFLTTSLPVLLGSKSF